MAIAELTTYAELEHVLSTKDSIKVYGAGDTAKLMLKQLKEHDPTLLSRIKCVTATKVYGKPPEICGVPVVRCDDAAISKNDYVILAMKDEYCQDVQDFLKETGATIVQCSNYMIHGGKYHVVESVLRPIMTAFPGNAEQLLPKPVTDQKLYAWSMWWQGEENAPEIVKACFRSQRKYLPSDVEYVIITEKNYADYVELPDYILEKVRNGSMMLAHLSDLIRWLLLYQYGGLWIDATILVLKPLSRKIFEYPIYTKIEQTAYCGPGIDLRWTIYFMGGHPGHMLFQFLSTVFLVYLKEHESIMNVDYLMSDYSIGIAYNTYPNIKHDIAEIPRIKTARTLKNTQLVAQYDPEEFHFYTRDFDWCKLSYVMDWENSQQKGSVFEYICKNF